MLANDKNTVKMWDSVSGKELFSVQMGQGGYSSPLAFSPDGKRLVGGGGGGMKIWDAETSEELLTLKGSDNSSASSIAFSSDGNRLAISSHNQTVTIWDATPLPENKP